MNIQEQELTGRVEGMNIGLNRRCPTTSKHVQSVMAQLRDKRAGQDVRKACAAHHFVAAHILAAMVQCVFALG